ncbi:hypothetical protein B0H10DRAFT_1015993 [Mycena sp. CBHHK59/15]|nr:hypothetical protein B0H10DRAFT_1015993 [Mycena sp. CBHHK59/15]
MDVSTLRTEIKTEIKTWERTFKVNSGRDPTVQDIREQPKIAEKYKLYKKLSKAAPPKPSVTASDSPSTPPKSRARGSHHSSLLLSRPRSVAATQPLSGYNPFSPQKAKGKEKESHLDIHSNPFRITRDTSPDLFPAILQPLPSSSTSAAAGDPFAPAPTSAVSRARKRFRGEPVSPSPNKEKRRRMLSPLPRDRDGSDDDEDESSAANTSFVDDSPVKAPYGVRSFKLLFDEASTRPRFPLLRSKTVPTGLFGERIPRVLDSDDVDGMDIDGDPPMKHVNPILKLHKAPASNELGDQKSAVKEDLFAPSVNSRKRSTSFASDDEMNHEGLPQEPRAASSTLLAPSPPPPDQRVSVKHRLLNGKGKGKGKAAAAGYKNGKAPGSDDGNDTSDEDAEMDATRPRVRLFNRTASRAGFHSGSDLDEDADNFARRPAAADTLEPQTSSPSISLPETLLNILSLAPSFTHKRRDEQVVKQLLYGARRGNYDPSKGGEIWGVGELEEERDEFALDVDVPGSSGEMRGAHDDEDDWEGEGVPWEVGEL